MHKIYIVKNYKKLNEVLNISKNLENNGFNDFKVEMYEYIYVKNRKKYSKTIYKLITEVEKRRDVMNDVIKILYCQQLF